MEPMVIKCVGRRRIVVKTAEKKVHLEIWILDRTRLATLVLEPIEARNLLRAVLDAEVEVSHA